MFKIEKIDNNDVRLILIALLVSTEFCKQVRGFIDLKYFITKHSRIIAKWCLDYFDKHGLAPERHIYDVFNEDKINGNITEDDANNIKDILEYINNIYEDYKDFNYSYVLDRARNYFKKREFIELKENLDNSIAENDISACVDYINKFKLKDKIDGSTHNLLDEEYIINTFENYDDDCILTFPGKLNKLVGSLCREDFLAFFGPSKRGKSWWLMMLAIMGLLKNLKVIYINFEMSEKQFIRRIWQYLLAEIKFKDDEQYCVPIFDCIHNQKGCCPFHLNDSNICLLDNKLSFTKKKYPISPSGYRPCCKCDKDFMTRKIDDSGEIPLTTWYKTINKDGLDLSKILSKARELKKQIYEGNFKIINWPQGTKTIKDLKITLDTYESSEGFIPDIIVTDSADRFASSVNYKGEYRHSINEIWQDHRSLAQERKCLVLTASHTNKFTNKADISQGDSTEDSRKEAHITHGITLDQTFKEKEMGIMRIGIMNKRDSAFDESRIYVLQQLEIGRPYLDSL